MPNSGKTFIDYVYSILCDLKLMKKKKTNIGFCENNKYTVYYLEKTVYQDEQSASCISSKCIMWICNEQWA